MMDGILEILVQIVPQSALAIVFFYLNQKSLREQRDAYERQIFELYNMMATMLTGMSDAFRSFRAIIEQDETT